MDLKEAKHRSKELISRHPWESARLDVVGDLIHKELKTINDKKGVLLDLGCGDTWFIEQLSERYPGIKYIGVDIHFTPENIAEINSKNVNKNIHVFSSLEEGQQALKDQKIEMVLLLDVIEHISDDIEFLKYVQTFPSITKDTNFMITVPAFQSLFSRHDVFLEHYRRYDNKMLIDHISQAGLKQMKIGYFFFSLLLARIGAVTVEKLGPKKTESTGLVEWGGGKAVSSIFKNILTTDFFISNMLSKVGLRLPGLSNYVLCKKS